MSTGLACLSAGELKAEHYTRRPLFGMSGHHATKHLPGSHGISAHHRVGCSGTTTRCLKLELSEEQGWEGRMPDGELSPHLPHAAPGIDPGTNALVLLMQMGPPLGAKDNRRPA